MNSRAERTSSSNATCETSLPGLGDEHIVLFDRRRRRGVAEKFNTLQHPSKEIWCRHRAFRFYDQWRDGGTLAECVDIMMIGPRTFVK